MFWPHRTDPRLYATAGRLAATVNGPGGALYDGTWFEGGGGREPIGPLLLLGLVAAGLLAATVSGVLQLARRHAAAAEAA